jgi:hypothetical protein
METLNRKGKTMSETVSKVYGAIVNVMEEMSRIGISKDRKNQQQGYSFRGIDDIYNALGSVLAKHKLCILPRVRSHQTVERTNKSGGLLLYTTCDVDFDLISAEDGSRTEASTFGEAMDSADKSGNKSMSAAMKYACLMIFLIPTQADNDADAVTHEVNTQKPAAPPPASRAAPPPRTAPPPAAKKGAAPAPTDAEAKARTWVNKILALMEPIRTEEAMRELMDTATVKKNVAGLKANMPQLYDEIADGSRAMLERIGKASRRSPPEDYDDGFPVQSNPIGA